MATDSSSALRPHSVSVVVPVYQGENTLAALIEELAPLTSGVVSPEGHTVVVTEVILVHDNGPDRSPDVMRGLAQRYPFVRTVWLSRNFGQHAATLAGMASSGGDWIVTMDEDGQHDPQAIAQMVDVAMEQQADVVYARPLNEAPHGFGRNVASRTAKLLLRISTGQRDATDFQSYRLVLGEVGRSVAAYAGPGVYLDVAMRWVARRTATSPVMLRTEGDRPSGYSLRSLVSHFWRMVLSSGTRALRLVSLLGVVFAVAGFVLAVYLLVVSLSSSVVVPQGWPSLMVALLLTSGAVLFSLGVIAEYIGVAVSMAMGRPLYLIVSDGADGPLGRPRAPAPTAPGITQASDEDPRPEQSQSRSVNGPPPSVGAAGEARPAP